MSLGGRMGTSPTQDWVLLAALGLGAYVLYQIFGGVRKLGQGAAAVAHDAADVYNQFSETLDSTPDASGATWSSWYDPTLRSVWIYVLTFPDGARHVIGAVSVQPDGTFTYNNTLYRIGIDRAGGLRAYDYSAVLGNGAPALVGEDFGVTNPAGWN